MNYVLKHLYPLFTTTPPSGIALLSHTAVAKEVLETLQKVAESLGVDFQFYDSGLANSSFLSSLELTKNTFLGVNHPSLLSPPPNNSPTLNNNEHVNIRRHPSTNRYGNNEHVDDNNDYNDDEGTEDDDEEYDEEDESYGEAFERGQQRHDNSNIKRHRRQQQQQQQHPPFTCKPLSRDGKQKETTTEEDD